MSPANIGKLKRRVDKGLPLSALEEIKITFNL